MKPSIHLGIALVLAFHVATGQDSIQYTTKGSIVTPVKLNVLYLGVDNPVMMSVPGSEKLYATCDNGKFIQKGDQWYIHVDRKAPCTINLYDKKGKPQGSWYFIVRKLPCPEMTFGGKPFQVQMDKRLMLASAIIPVTHNFYFELFYIVIRYRLMVMRAGGSTETFSGEGNQLTEEMKAAIRSLNPGDKVMLFDSEVRTADGSDDTACNPSSITVEIK